jgi:hypothetical protein
MNEMQQRAEGGFSSSDGPGAMPDEPGHELPAAAGAYTKASLILFFVAAALVILDVIGAVCVEVDVISSSDQLVILGLASVPVILLLVVVGTILGVLGRRADRKASRHSSRMTNAAVGLNVTLLVVGVLIVLATLLLVTVLLSGLGPR